MRFVKSIYRMMRATGRFLLLTALMMGALEGGGGVSVVAGEEDCALAKLMSPWRNYWQSRRSAIESDIRRLRMRDYVFVLTDAAGHALTNADVEVRQVSSDFIWGCASLSLGQLGAKNAAYEARLSEFFNTVTTTFCPDAIVPEENVWRFDESSDDIWRRPPPDRVFAFARRHGLRFKGQPLLCDHWHPTWAVNQTKAEAEKFYRNFFCRVAERYGTSAWAFDVVNEAFCAKWRNPRFPLYGGDEDVPFVDWAYAEAAKVFPPGCALNVNMGIEATDWNNQGRRYYELCKRIVDAGIRLDGIGLQFHLFSDNDLARLIRLEQWHPQMLSELFAKLGSLNRPVYINEITIPSTLLRGAAGEAVQAEVASDLYRFWFSCPSIYGITWWNLMDGAAWEGEDRVKGALLDDFAREKPVYQALRNLIAREWRTAFRTQTDADGRIHFRGFSGDYEVCFMNAKGNALEVRRFCRKASKQKDQAPLID